MKPVKLAFDVVHPDGDTQRNLPPVILLHGMTDTRKTWKALAPRIAKETGRTVYAYDARNHGDSEWSKEFNFDILASDLEGFMNEMGISRAVLIGHSMGGKTALTLALKEPRRVEKLIVEDMSARNWSLKPGTVNPVSMLISLLREGLNSIPVGSNYSEAQKALLDFMSQFMHPDNPQVFETFKLPLKRTENGRYEWQANLDVLEDVLSNLDNLKQTLSGVYMGDALFLYGTKSVFRVDRDRLIPQLFPRSQRIPIQGGGHMLHTEYPKVFLQHVVSFILSPDLLQSKY